MIVDDNNNPTPPPPCSPPSPCDLINIYELLFDCVCLPIPPPSPSTAAPLVDCLFHLLLNEEVLRIQMIKKTKNNNNNNNLEEALAMDLTRVICLSAKWRVV